VSTLTDKQQRAYDRWQEAHGTCLRIGAHHQMACGGFTCDTAAETAREIDRASDPELDRSMVPVVFLPLWNARRAAKAHHEICVMRGVPREVMRRRAAQLLEAVGTEYTR
jgi:hypothetical protein